MDTSSIALPIGMAERKDVTPAPFATTTDLYTAIAVFDKYDADHNGLISKEQLTVVIKSLDAKFFTDDRIRELRTHMDADQDGNVNYKDFLTSLSAPRVLTKARHRKNKKRKKKKKKLSARIPLSSFGPIPEH